MQQLYIDGKLADISESTEVSLTIVSNLLTGAADFVGNRSLTISLPSTMNNRQIISQADKVHTGNGVPYHFHNIEYMRNGVRVIAGGVGRLMSAGPDKIEIAVTWGVRAAVDALLVADDTLNDITTNAAITFNATPVVTAYTDAQTDEVFYAALDMVKHAGINEYFRMHISMSGGKAWDTSNLQPSSSYLHPSVRMNWILGKLTARYGTTFDFGVAQADIDTMIVPLVNKIPNDITFNYGYAATIAEPPTWGGMAGNYVKFTTTNPSAIIGTLTAPYISLPCATAFKGVVKFSIYFYINAADLTVVSYPIYHAMYGYRIIVSVGSDQQYVELLPEDMDIMVTSIVANRVNLYATGYLPVEMTVGQTLNMRIGCIDNGIYDIDLGAGIHIQGGNIWVNDIIGSDNEVQPGQAFPVGGNLPDIKPVDLVKFLAAVTGTFPVQASTDYNLIFKPVSDVFDFTRAVDWSDRVLSESTRPVAKKIEYAVGGWAQRNMWRWLEDETVNGDYDGGIDVDDETLEESRDIMTFPFAATDGNNIPVYTSERKWDGDAGDWYDEIKYKEVKPRVLRMIEGNNSEAVGTFDMDMTTVIANKYGELPATMAHPIVITETMRMTDVQMATIDETRPIYLQQHAAHFALLELTAKAGGIAEVKLLKLTKTEE